MSIEINLTGKVALITGASQGIGAQMARTFHRAGATVALNHPDLVPTRADAEALAAELNRLRPQSALVVAAITYLCSPAHRNLTGSTLLLDGGLSLLRSPAGRL